MTGTPSGVRAPPARTPAAAAAAPAVADVTSSLERMVARMALGPVGPEQGAGEWVTDCDRRVHVGVFGKRNLV